MKIISLDKGCFAFILGLLLWCSHMHANYIDLAIAPGYWQSTVSGIVSDAVGPLPGVTINVKGSSSYAVSDDSGKYSINAAIGDTLVFSFIGFKDSEQVVTSPTLDVMLIEDTAQLAEVVINAGYYSVKDKERTGSIARITAKDIENQPVTNILATMQGRMAGVSVTQNTGVPGGGFDIQIRGINSLRAEGNNPLYIIDGVPYSSDGLGSNVTGDIIPGPISPLNSISPENIASIEILKDADATAIYGSRGANGVVLVTTKKGKAGKTAFFGKVSSGAGKVARRWDLLNTAQYLAIRREAFANDGIAPGPADFDVNGTWDETRYTDWQDYFIGNTATFSDIQASVSGGSEQTRFLVGSSYHKETTVFPGDFNYRKGNVFTSLSHESSDKRFRLALTSGYTVQDNLQPASDLTRQALFIAPNAPALYDGQGNLNWENSTWTNPLSLLMPLYRSNTTDLTSSLSLGYDLGWGFSAKVGAGFTDTRFKDSSTLPSDMFDPAFELGSDASSIYVNNNTRSSWIIEPQLDWQGNFGNLKVQALAGATFQHQKSTQLLQEAIGFNSNSQLYNLAAANFTFINADTETKYRYQAVFSRVNLNWDGRYIVNITGRRDGSSRFGPGRQFADFGAVGAAWIFSREAFMGSVPFISFAKLRASYGTSGSDQIGDYQFIDSYSSTGNNYGGIPGLEPSRLYNADFGWETNRKFEVALETGFLKDRIFMTAAYFNNRSSSQLVGVPLPGTTGFSSIQANLDATVQNSGVEFTLRTENLKVPGLAWVTSFNVSVLKNKLVSFPDLEASTYRNRYIVGQPLNIAKVYKYEGLDPETGLYTFRDYNGDGLITAAEDRGQAIDLNPSFFGGLQNTLNWKGWQLDFLFQFVKQKNYNTSYSFDMPGTFINQPANVLGRWQQPGDSEGLQRFSSGSDPSATEASTKYQGSDAVITDASFIRLKNLSVSYTVPEKWLAGIGLRLFMEGQNLMLITPYKGADPESRFTSNLPPLRVITGGVQLTF